MKPTPYIIKHTTKETHEHNPEYPEDDLCVCGHAYYRHFDTYENMSPVGCKYCECYQFMTAEGDCEEPEPPAKVMPWIRMTDRLPLTKPGQVDILFCSDGWATFVRGMFTYYGEGKYELSGYDQIRDKFYEWEHEVPTYWQNVPEVPSNRVGSWED